MFDCVLTGVDPTLKGMACKNAVKNRREVGMVVTCTISIPMASTSELFQILYHPYPHYEVHPFVRPTILFFFLMYKGTWYGGQNRCCRPPPSVLWLCESESNMVPVPWEHFAEKLVPRTVSETHLAFDRSH